jgi:hypothetical protein
MGATARNIKIPPKVAPGMGMTEAVHAGLYMAESDTFAVGDTLPVTLFTVPKNVYIYDFILDTQTAFADSGGATGGATLIAGYNGDSDAFFSSTTTYTVGVRSMHGSAGGVKAGGYLTTGTMTIEASWATTCSVGGGQARIIFKPYGDESFLDNP